MKLNITASTAYIFKKESQYISVAGKNLHSAAFFNNKG